MFHALRTAIGGFVFAVLLVAAGCTGSALPRSYPASGKVVYKGGQPLTGGSIQFTSTSDPLLRVIGEIAKDGTFSLRTHKDNAMADGAPEGEYQVSIQPPLVHDPRDGLKFAHKGVPAIQLVTTYKVEPHENTFLIDVLVPPPRP